MSRPPWVRPHVDAESSQRGDGSLRAREYLMSVCLRCFGGVLADGLLAAH